EDYVFEEGGTDIADDTTARKVRFSELFAPGKDTLLAYSYMYGPAMANPCPMCTSLLDGLNGQSPHVVERANFVVIAKSPIARIRNFARGRGWKNLRLLSSDGTTYNTDYHGESPTGGQLPTMNVFVRREGKIHHSWSSELLFIGYDPGQDGRHVDLFWP